MGAPPRSAIRTLATSPTELISAAMAALQRSGHPDLLRRWLASSLPLACDLLVYSH